MNRWLYMGGFCDLLIKHMEKGHSYDSFPATIKYPKEVVDSWLATKPSFAEAKSMGETARLKMLEDMLFTKCIDLKTFQHLTASQSSDIDIEQFDDSTLIQARERFVK
jgi:hypothetical protein